eukprot:1129764-Rhodomonas_salina.3
MGLPGGHSPGRPPRRDRNGTRPLLSYAGPTRCPYCATGAMRCAVLSQAMLLRYVRYSPRLCCYQAPGTVLGRRGSPASSRVT